MDCFLCSARQRSFELCLPKLATYLSTVCFQNLCTASQQLHNKMPPAIAFIIQITSDNFSNKVNMISNLRSVVASNGGWCVYINSSDLHKVISKLPRSHPYRHTVEGIFASPIHKLSTYHIGDGSYYGPAPIHVNQSNANFFPNLKRLFLFYGAQGHTCPEDGQLADALKYLIQDTKKTVETLYIKALVRIFPADIMEWLEEERLNHLSNIFIDLIPWTMLSPGYDFFEVCQGHISTCGCPNKTKQMTMLGKEKCPKLQNGIFCAHVYRCIIERFKSRHKKNPPETVNRFPILSDMLLPVFMGW